LNLKDKQNCNAQFRTVICLILNGEEFLFEDICKGKITERQKGTNGFGYDSVFVPEGAMKTFAEMTMDQKNKFSHRKKAVDKLVVFLNQLHTNK
jgi:XTP/dITP diphosphohydrolase